MPCAFCDLGICINPAHREGGHRRSIKALPTAKEYRQKRIERFQEHRRERRQDLLWRRRTEEYQVDEEGFFEGSYRRGNGKQVLVQGSTVGQVRWEKEEGERLWQRVPYQAPT